MLNPNDLGKYFVAENCRKIRIEEYLRQARISLRKAIVEAQMTVNGHTVKLSQSKTHFGGIRLWFNCPECHQRRGVLYQHPFSANLACRKCMGIMYKQQRYKGMT